MLAVFENERTRAKSPIYLYVYFNSYKNGNAFRCFFNIPQPYSCCMFPTIGYSRPAVITFSHSCFYFCFPTSFFIIITSPSSQMGKLKVLPIAKVDKNMRFLHRQDKELIFLYWKFSNDGINLNLFCRSVSLQYLCRR